MALAVPLGQSALSLVFDKVSGRARASWKSTSMAKTKKKHFTMSANNVRRNQGKQEAYKTGGEKANFSVTPAFSVTVRMKNDVSCTNALCWARLSTHDNSSWLNTDCGLRDKGAKRVPKFGGWDQPDDQVETQKGAPSQKGNGLPKQQKKGKFSRIGRVRETPLLLRLLIAVFPFLGSWTKFLF
ncbi:hypothetical protein CRYUN_Cryun09bG0202500 [Craigia yunnanensis]